VIGPALTTAGLDLSRGGEDIATIEQRLFLRRLNCDYAWMSR